MRRLHIPLLTIYGQYETQHNARILELKVLRKIEQSWPYFFISQYIRAHARPEIWNQDIASLNSSGSRIQGMGGKTAPDLYQEIEISSLRGKIKTGRRYTYPVGQYPIKASGDLYYEYKSSATWLKPSSISFSLEGLPVSQSHPLKL